MDISSHTLDFIKAHAHDDVRKLALSASRNGDVDLSFALDQIRGRQIAQHKLPSWAATEGIIFPPHISMEQCSSEQTARYKARVVERFVEKENCCLVDMTGGFGVDFSFLAQGFRRCIYIERQQHLCDIARHNLPLLGLRHAEIIYGDGEEWVKTECMGSGTFIFLDPARRDTNGKRTYAIADCTPDVLSFIDELAGKAAAVMIKLSPMLDWHATVMDINRAVKGHDAVREVHIISTANECKELLIVVSIRSQEPLKIFCVNDEQLFSFARNNGTQCTAYANPAAGKVLMIPNASIMKAGCFDDISTIFRIKQISSNSHIFVSDHAIEGFPGKSYEIIAVSSMNKKVLRTTLQGIEQANIATRNFPMSPEELRKQLKLKDGGNIYLFATTTEEKEHIIVVTTKQLNSQTTK